MSKNQNLLTIREVAEYYGLSIQSIRRRLRESKNKSGSFPSPVFGYKKKLLFHRNEIESWKESEPEQPEHDR
jgi:predicted DNA-binding transcriptional regulator AlpA